MLKKNRNIWITKDGTALFLYEMSDDHLVNAYKMVRRKLNAIGGHIASAYGFLGSLNGEMAQYAAESETDIMEDAAQSLTNSLNELKKEIDSRGLEV